jgi:hypothetical protein
MTNILFYIAMLVWSAVMFALGEYVYELRLDIQEFEEL